MSIDLTRRTFEPRKHFTGVAFQQGRPQIEADANEAAEIAGEAGRRELLDIVGPAGSPDDGFKVTNPRRESVGGVAELNFDLGQGSLYVGGVRVEQDSPTLTFLNQPDWLPSDRAATDAIAPLPASGTRNDLVYLELLYQQEVGAFEDTELLEPALGGVDSAARWKTLARVKVQENVGTDDCATAWSALTSSWAASYGSLPTGTDGRPIPGEIATNARLRVGFVTGGTAADLCTPAVAGGYLGAENQAVRVRLVDATTLVWGFDNAAPLYRVQIVDTAKTIVEFQTLPRDVFHHPRAGQPIEVLWHAAELPNGERVASLTGHLTTVATAYNPDTRRLTLTAAYPKAVQDAAGNNLDLYVRMWQETVAYTAGTAVTLGSTGLQATITGTQRRPGDYWVIGVRPSNPTKVYPWALQPPPGSTSPGGPPDGVRRFACPLAIITWDAGTIANTTVHECRPHFDDLVELTNRPHVGCDCTVCVTAESHNAGDLTIQRAIDEVATTGGKVCLAPGVYVLDTTPVRLQQKYGVRIEGHGWRTILVYTGEGAAIEIDSCADVTIEGITVATLLEPLTETTATAALRAAVAALTATSPGVASGVLIRNSAMVVVRRCNVLGTGPFAKISEPRLDNVAPAIGLSGFVVGTFLRENVLLAAGGVAPVYRASGQSYLITAGLFIEDNAVLCGEVGIVLRPGLVAQFSETRIQGNFIAFCFGAGIATTTLVLPGSPVNIVGNHLQVSGSGVLLGSSEGRVINNEITGRGAEHTRLSDGIALTAGLAGLRLERIDVSGNRIREFSRYGVNVQARLGSLTIKQNVIEETGQGGVVMSDGEADAALVENNVLRDIAPAVNDAGTHVAGIRLGAVTHAQIAHNVIAGVGMAAAQNPTRVGIEAVACPSVRIAGNDLSGIGPEQFFNDSIGVAVVAPFDRVQVSDNLVRRSDTTPSAPASRWYGVQIADPLAGAIRGWYYYAVVPSAGAAAASGVVAGGAAGGAVTFADHYVVITDDVVVVLPRAESVVAVNGNLVEAYGDREALQVAAGVVTCSDNRCLLRSGARPAVAHLTAAALIASANYLDGLEPGADRTGYVALQVDAPPGTYTILGNVTDGKIRVGTTDLAVPWAPLNVNVP